MHSLGLSLNNITEKLYNQKSKYLGKIISNWQLIIGNDLANSTRPATLKFSKVKNIYKGNLTIYVMNNASSIALDYKKDYIIEKIAIYFGFKVITKIILVLNSEIFTEKKIICKKTTKYSLTDSDMKKIEIKNIDDENLRNSLYNLGKLVLLDSKRLNNEDKI